MEQKFCCKINPDIEYLDEISKKYKWIPGKENIRPSDDILNEKEKYLSNINKFYKDERHYILSEIFNFDSSINEEGKLYVKDINIKKNIY